MEGVLPLGDGSSGRRRKKTMNKSYLSGRVGVIVALAVYSALGACVTSPPSAKPVVSVPPPPGLGKGYSHDPFPSTYKPYPGVPTLVRNVTVFDGEGGRIDHGAVLFADGKVVQVGQDIAVPDGAAVIDGGGKWLTPGIIDVHSHIGGSTLNVAAEDDINELTSPVTPGVWVEHSVWPNDPGFIRDLTNGGVTTLQVLPGSGNLFGGRSIVLKNVYARTIQGMKFPGAPYGLKMACGENPKRVYGSKGQLPSTRMGNIELDRETWAKAVEYKRKWDHYEEKGGDPPARDLGMDTLRGVLNGEILVHNHCYRADEMANMIDVSKEFGYHVTAFHHAIEGYKIADLLQKNGICAAVFADQFGFKMEAYDGINENMALLFKAGVCVMIHSDEHNGAQHLNQEVGKAIAAGKRAGIDIPDETAWRFLSFYPAKALGISDKTGSLRPGKMADIVLWNGNPFSVYTRPEKVWVDGAMLYDSNNPRLRPVSDFELGQPGEGVVK
jgi:imidazolonepropionase-like amidohydrolase